MLIFPAIDIIESKCVRLAQGDYRKKKIYSNNPSEIAKKFETAGASFLHIVDLDGAKEGNLVNLGAVRKILQTTDLSVQVGGGIRSIKDAKKLFDLGVDRVILGTSAVRDKSLVANLLKRYGPESIVVSIDAKDENILVEGWLKDTDKNLFKFLDELIAIGVKTIIYTDIKSDGMMKGPNFKNIKKVVNSGLNVIVAGGVSSIENLRKLKEINTYGVIIGKALYEGFLDLSKVIKAFQVTNLAKRIIPCMDIKNGRVVKGTYFKNLKDAGDPVVLAKKYSELGADELVFLDITATAERRKTLRNLVKRVARNINIPFTVGGGISSLEDIKNLLNSGADKITIGSAAIRNPQLISQAARAFGSQCVVISLDAKKTRRGWNVFIDGGKTDSGKDALQFASEMEKLGAGELLVNSLDRDGTKLGYDNKLLNSICGAVRIPIIASSGAGKKEDFLEAFKKSRVDAVLAASVFHYGEVKIPNLKKFLRDNNITIRS